jgi:hypothetical protein
MVQTGAGSGIVRRDRLSRTHHNRQLDFCQGFAQSSGHQAGSASGLLCGLTKLELIVWSLPFRPVFRPRKGLALADHFGGFKVS